ncbi:hypothetical protein M8C21_016501 [Ambrosia artemisiifolia]|uniref:Uncharacterized protein n=1 Tax=Ambrosia artemisiifolia TaxID=4212 RepID=A0AAD5DH62_AMBAR|nr:hypothetical protein M8C21_016501 [Ambrosia artemisiifolia]
MDREDDDHAILTCEVDECINIEHTNDEINQQDQRDKPPNGSKDVDRHEEPDQREVNEVPKEEDRTPNEVVAHGKKETAAYDYVIEEVLKKQRSLTLGRVGHNKNTIQFVEFYFFLDPRVNERDIEDEFRTFGVIKSVWVARRPPGYGFVDFDDKRDALDAIRELDGKNGWRVEMSHNSRGSGGGGGGGGRGGGRGRSGGSDLKCYECGESGHFARECRGGGGGRRRSRSRSPAARYRRSPSYGRRSYSPRGRSPPRRNNYSRSPPYRGRDAVPYANG